MKRLVVALVVASACSSSDSDGFAVDLTVVAASDVAVDQISTLTLVVSGDEQFTARDISAAGKFKSGRAGIRYKPGIASGSLDFALTAFDDNAAELGNGRLTDLTLVPGKTQTATIILEQPSTPDGGVDANSVGDLSSLDLTSCGNSIVESDEACDPGPGSSKACPASTADCDDQNPCTTDVLSGSGCQATCTHTAVTDQTGCSIADADGGVSGVCLGGNCCTGCVSGGACKPGNSDPQLCGKLGSSCFDCATNSATATCDFGQCSGCDAASCTNEGRTCGTSSCGFNCGGCPDKCLNGAINHYACINKSCQQNGLDGCPAPTNATASCNNNACTWGCNANFKPCIGACISSSGCCDTSECPGEANATVSCGSDHACHLTCSRDSLGIPTTGDCDGNYFNGCETPLQTNTNCNQCGNSCGAGCCDLFEMPDRVLCSTC